MAATFVYADWAAMFPELSGVSSPQASAYFLRACLICANDSTNPADALGLLTTLLYLLTAHIAWLNAPRDAQGNPSAGGAPAPNLVGRINSASEGSVSVGVEWSGAGSPSEAWFLQTRYGAEYWQATAQFRTMRYAANPTYVPGSGAFPFFSVGRRW